MDINLKFIDEDGKADEVKVSQECFLIGRHSENDLSIVNSKLSRTHAKIERFADVFVFSDCNSSNGTKLNGEELIEPQTLANGDILDIGGGVEIEVEFPGENENTSEEGGKDSNENDSGNVNANPASFSPNSSTNSKSGFGLRSVLILVPLLGIFLILSIVGVFFLFSRRI